MSCSAEGCGSAFVAAQNGQEVGESGCLGELDLPSCPHGLLHEWGRNPPLSAASTCER